METDELLEWYRKAKIAQAELKKHGIPTVVELVPTREGPDGYQLQVGITGVAFVALMQMLVTFLEARDRPQAKGEGLPIIRPGGN